MLQLRFVNEILMAQIKAQREQIIHLPDNIRQLNIISAARNHTYLYLRGKNTYMHNKICHAQINSAKMPSCRNNVRSTQQYPSVPIK